MRYFLTIHKHFTSFLLQPHNDKSKQTMNFGKKKCESDKKKTSYLYFMFEKPDTHIPFDILHFKLHSEE